MTYIRYDMCGKHGPMKNATQALMCVIAVGTWLARATLTLVSREVDMHCY